LAERNVEKILDIHSLKGRSVMKSVLGAVAGLAVGLMIGLLAGTDQREAGFRKGIDQATTMLQREAVKNGHARWRREDDGANAFEWIEVRPDYAGGD
jgi:hypothetical protein